MFFIDSDGKAKPEEVQEAVIAFNRRNDFGFVPVPVSGIVNGNHMKIYELGHLGEYCECVSGCEYVFDALTRCNNVLLQRGAMIGPLDGYRPGLKGEGFKADIALAFAGKDIGDACMEGRREFATRLLHIPSVREVGFFDPRFKRVYRN